MILTVKNTLRRIGINDTVSIQILTDYVGEYFSNLSK